MNKGRESLDVSPQAQDQSNKELLKEATGLPDFPHPQNPIKLSAKKSNSKGKSLICYSKKALYSDGWNFQLIIRIFGHFVLLFVKF